MSQSTEKTMPKMKQFVLKAAFLAVIVLSTSGAANAKEFNQYVGFGDSTLDSGYWRYNKTGVAWRDAQIVVAVASGDSGAYNANGVENSIILAGKFGLSAAPVGAPVAEPIMPTVPPILRKSTTRHCHTLTACPLSRKFRITSPLSTASPIPMLSM